MIARTAFHSSPKGEFAEAGILINSDDFAAP
jgi:hypothetical protein